MTAQQAKATAESAKWTQKKAWEVTKIIEKKALKGEFSYLYKLYPFTYKEMPKVLELFNEYDRKDLQQRFAKYFDSLGYQTKITGSLLMISWLHVEGL